MRVVGAVEKKDRDQHQGSNTQHRKHHPGMLVAAVVNLHRHHHGGEAGGGPSHLSQQEKVAGAVALLRHDGRRAEYHHQSHKYQDQGDGKKPAIDAYTLGHGKFISPRRREVAEQNVCEFPGGCNYLGSSSGRCQQQTCVVHERDARA